MRLRALVDHNIDFVVFHRRIQVLLDDPVHAVDLIDEQNVSFAQCGQDPDQIDGALQHRTGSGVQAHSQLVGDDMRQCRLPQTRRAVEEDVIQRFAALVGGRYRNTELFLDLFLPQHLVHRFGAESVVEIPLISLAVGIYDAFFHTLTRP